MSDALSILEAILFSSRVPLTQAEVASALPPGSDLDALLARLSTDYEARGLVVSRTRAGLSIRTAPAASDLASGIADPVPRLTRPAMETLACIAAFEEAGAALTRGEIERVRGVGLSPNILDALLHAGYVRPGRRRETRGRPLTWLVTDHFHDAFGLMGLADITAFAEMRDAGLAVLGALDVAPDEEAGDEEGAA